MPGRRLTRYIAYNATLWVAVALVGALVLTGARQYGHAAMARQTALHLLDGALKAAERGALYEAQRTIREALAAYPPISPEVAAEFGRTMTGMPLVRAEMLRLDKDGAAPLGEAGRLTLLLAGGPTRELTLARPAPDAGESNLSLGRTKLTQGDVTGAAQCFNMYWAGQDARRAEIAAKLLAKNTKSGADAYAAGKRLLFNGLLPEAMAAFDRARAAGYENADLLFWKGAAAELDGRRDEAQASYAEAIKLLPNHRLALVRTKALERH
jgi:tetratricopeptide (TPR) repeat protein